MLRVLIQPVSAQDKAEAATAAGEASASKKLDAVALGSLSSDLKRAKWLDDETFEMGLTRHPSMGINK